ncbi:DUF3107 domain-containing protein [Propionicicella superfundia]|uniref:DUF3107 domain-containing protein n=1 Tax=Propionicicella superfundia TaxID=348582 RepID=UPI00040B523F|nr:DUF3107 domain-containing protein [Propionicicella superfundia]
MEIKIGIKHAPREVSIETDETAEQIESLVREAFTGDGLLALLDTKGRKVLIPIAGIAYLDLGSEHVRPVGFGAV